MIVSWEGRTESIALSFLFVSISNKHSLHLTKDSNIRNKEGEKFYALLPLIPGVFEFPFMKGGGTFMHKRLGQLWEEYHHEVLGASFAGQPTAVVRVVAVEKSIPAQDRVHPYEEVKNLINNANYVALTKCACRVSVGKCDKPKEVCLIYGEAAEFLAERFCPSSMDSKELFCI